MDRAPRLEGRERNFAVVGVPVGPIGVEAAQRRREDVDPLVMVDERRLVFRIGLVIPGSPDKPQPARAIEQTAASRNLLMGALQESRS